MVLSVLSGFFIGLPKRDCDCRCSEPANAGTVPPLNLLFAACRIAIQRQQFLEMPAGARLLLQSYYQIRSKNMIVLAATEVITCMGCRPGMKKNLLSKIVSMRYHCTPFASLRFSVFSK